MTPGNSPYLPGSGHRHKVIMYCAKSRVREESTPGIHGVARTATFIQIYAKPTSSYVAFLNDLYRSILSRESLYFDSDQDDVDFDRVEEKADREGEKRRRNY